MREDYRVITEYRKKENRTIHKYPKKTIFQTTDTLYKTNAFKLGEIVFRCYGQFLRKTLPYPFGNKLKQSLGGKSISKKKRNRA